MTEAEASRPEHVKCGNCIFFVGHRKEGPEDGNCHRYPPPFQTSFNIKSALTQIHWVLSEGRTEYADDKSADNFDPETDNDFSEFPSIFSNSWCGEFRGAW